MGIEAVIFDFGNVLMGWSPETLYRRLIPDDAERRYFLTEICNSAWIIEQDRGRPWEIAIAERCAAFPEQAPLIRAFYDHWPEMLTGPIAEGHDILQRVRAAGIPAFGLTNWSGETYDRTAPDLGFLTHLEYVAVSGHLKMAKPEPEIYHHLLERIGRPAENCLFFDDSAANIATARRIGMKAVQFRNDGSALAEARALGLAV